MGKNVRVPLNRSSQPQLTPAQICFLGTMSLRRDALEKSATNHGGTITKKAEDADIIVKGAHISENQAKDLTDHGRETITEEDFKVSKPINTNPLSALTDTSSGLAHNR